MKSSVIVAERNQFGPKIPREVREAAEDAVRWVNRRFTALEKSVALSVLRVKPRGLWFLYQTLPGRTIDGGFYWMPAISTISTRTPERARACIRIIIDLANASSECMPTGSDSWCSRRRRRTETAEGTQGESA